MMRPVLDTAKACHWQLQRLLECRPIGVACMCMVSCNLLRLLNNQQNSNVLFSYSIKSNSIASNKQTTCGCCWIWIFITGSRILSLIWGSSCSCNCILLWKGNLIILLKKWSFVGQKKTRHIYLIFIELISGSSQRGGMTQLRWCSLNRH